MIVRETRAFTLVELLVVIAIIGILMSMTLPAIQSAREAGRKTQCRNNVRNLAMGCTSHLEANKYFPTGGWGWGWAGDPDRGFGMRQPGGWIFSILPYIEETTLANMGKGQPDAAKRAAGKTRVGTPVGIFHCPTRRRPDQFAYIHGTNYVNIDRPSVIARTDYAANGGDTGFNTSSTYGPGIDTLTKKCDSAFVGLFNSTNSNSTGIVSQVSQWPAAAVRDGLSKTYLVGERYLHVSTYESGSPADDDQGWDVAYDWDNVRWTNVPPKNDEQVDNVNGGNENFGSIHLAAFHMAMCDNSVKSVNYEIDSTVHRQCGNRKDGGPSEMTGIE
jgi:prepilin-type N-terminal cleavage/methylation domain-containing protein